MCRKDFRGESCCFNVNKIRGCLFLAFYKVTSVPKPFSLLELKCNEVSLATLSHLRKRCSNTHFFLLPYPQLVTVFI